jgi:hypothetical protein
MGFVDRLPMLIRKSSYCAGFLLFSKSNSFNDVGVLECIMGLFAETIIKIIFHISIELL